MGNAVAARAQEAAVTPVERAIQSQKDRFLSVVANKDPRVWESEAAWALQALGENNYLMGVAQKNPGSLKDAVFNVASTGLSLNPVRKLAYLIPRNGKVCLDISYRGYIQAAIDSGRIKAVQAVDLVFSNDVFEHEERIDGVHFLHKRPRLNADRGTFEGAYCVVILADGTRLVTVMTADEIDAIEKRAMKNTKGTGPWTTDRDEMRKKTVVRRAAKLWPIGSVKASAQEAAIERVDLSGELGDGAIDATVPPPGADAVDPTVIDGEIVDEETGEIPGYVETNSEPEIPFETGPTTIDAEQQEIILASIKLSGLPLKKLLEAFRLEKLEDLEVERYEAVLARLSEYKMAVEKRNREKAEKKS